eukprot:gene18379-25889_t
MRLASMALRPRSQSVLPPCAGSAILSRRTLALALKIPSASPRSQHDTSDWSSHARPSANTRATADCV